MGASVTIERRVQWIDTDAAGVCHNSVVHRWAEDAEAELHRRMGIIDETFGVTPRVRVEFEFAAPLRFDDVVDIALTVADLGETSVTYLIKVRNGQELAVSGKIVAVYIDGESGVKRPWPDHLRRALSSGS
ncbi:MAG: thioesterase family protein [Acidimicrobiia bacterium]